MKLYKLILAFSTAHQLYASASSTSLEIVSEDIDVDWEFYESILPNLFNLAKHEKNRPQWDNDPTCSKALTWYRLLYKNPKWFIKLLNFTTGTGEYSDENGTGCDPFLSLIQAFYLHAKSVSERRFRTVFIDIVQQMKPSAKTLDPEAMKYLYTSHFLDNFNAFIDLIEYYIDCFDQQSSGNLPVGVVSELLYSDQAFDSTIRTAQTTPLLEDETLSLQSTSPSSDFQILADLLFNKNSDETLELSVKELNLRYLKPIWALLAYGVDLPLRNTTVRSFRMHLAEIWRSKVLYAYLLNALLSKTGLNGDYILFMLTFPDSADTISNIIFQNGHLEFDAIKVIDSQNWQKSLNTIFEEYGILAKGRAIKGLFRDLSSFKVSESLVSKYFEQVIEKETGLKNLASAWNCVPDERLLRLYSYMHSYTTKEVYESLRSVYHTDTTPFINSNTILEANEKSAEIVLFTGLLGRLKTFSYNFLIIRMFFPAIKQNWPPSYLLLAFHRWSINRPKTFPTFINSLVTNIIRGNSPLKPVEFINNYLAPLKVNLPDQPFTDLGDLVNKVEEQLHLMDIDDILPLLYSHWDALKIHCLLPVMASIITEKLFSTFTPFAATAIKRLIQKRLLSLPHPPEGKLRDLLESSYSGLSMKRRKSFWEEVATESPLHTLRPDVRYRFPLLSFLGELTQ